MTITATHWLLRAEEAHATAQLCEDPVLRGLLQEIAQSYEELAESRYRGMQRALSAAGTGTGMQDYRAFIMDAAGHVSGRQEFDAADDASALRHAQQYAQRDDVEVWQHQRMVGMVRCKGHVDGAA
jgi:hypothetical protein